MSEVSAVTPSQDNITTAIRVFLTAALPDGTQIIQGQVNRVPEPKGDFAVFWPLSQGRLATNDHVYEDVIFYGQIDGTVLSVIIPSTDQAVSVGDVLFGQGILAGTQVTEQLSELSSGTVLNAFALNTMALNAPATFATYRVNKSQTVSFELIACGKDFLIEATDLVFQLDLHGPAAFGNAQIVAALMRDARGVDIFDDTGLGVTPLYSTDPTQLPFLNAEQQYENRYMVDLHLQANSWFTMPQQFADALVMSGIFNVDAQYPPT